VVDRQPTGCPFLAEVEERGEAGASLPWFVVGEFERYIMNRF
jgi:hypothetical protein